MIAGEYLSVHRRIKSFDVATQTILSQVNGLLSDETLESTDFDTEGAIP